jgi:dolichol-phosphate mannosyltransferase
MASDLIFTATYDEAANIERWIREVAHFQPDAAMLIVDDNSPDGTSEIIRSLTAEFPQIVLITRPRKEGLGSAHLLAMNYALEHQYSRFVSMDADLSHQPQQIQRLLERLDTAHFVIGTRSRGGSHRAGPLRRMLSHGANFTARTLLPTPVSEYTSSMRAFKPRALIELQGATFHYGGYAFFIECIEILQRAGVSMAEVPIDFLDRRSGKSKIPKTQIFTSMRALVTMSVQRFRKQE